MLWYKTLHIVFMVTWFAGLFYLPRLFVYHAMSDDKISRDRFIFQVKISLEISAVTAIRKKALRTKTTKSNLLKLIKRERAPCKLWWITWNFIATKHWMMDRGRGSDAPIMTQKNANAVSLLLGLIVLKWNQNQNGKLKIWRMQQTTIMKEQLLKLW